MLLDCFLGALTKVQKVIIHSIVCLSAKNNWLPLDGLSRNLIFDTLQKFKLLYNLTRITGTLYDDQGKLMIATCIILRMRNVSKL
jgi:hypothetical protein